MPYNSWISIMNSQHRKIQIGLQLYLILLERIENLRCEFTSLRDRDDLTEADQLSRNIRSFQTLLMQLEELESFGLPIVTHYQQRFDGQ